jgi:hypothetical protein
LLHVALQEGFANDSVQIHVNGREVFKKQNITTKTQIGFADSIELDLPKQPATVVVEVSSRRASETIALPQEDAVFLGISLSRDGRITHRISKEPFGYL